MDPAREVPGPDTREAIERLLLDGPRHYTRLQVARLAGMPPERTQRLWRALGFPDADDDDPAFTDADVRALGVLSELIDSGFVDEDAEASIARAMGQSLSRLADWQADMLAHAVMRGGPGGEGGGAPPPEGGGGGRVGRGGVPPPTRPWPWPVNCSRRCATSSTTSGGGTSRPTPGGCWRSRVARATAASSPSASPTWSGTPHAAGAWAAGSSGPWSRTSRASRPRSSPGATDAS